MFRAGRGETVQLRLDPEEAGLTENLLDELELIVEQPDALGDDVAARLQPDAVPDDRLAEEEFRDLAGDEIRRQRLDAVASIRETIDSNRAPDGRVRAVLDADSVEAWMISLNHLRLALGTALDIREESDIPVDLDESSPEGQRYLVYSWLSWAMEMLVDASAALIE